ncbi:hypothetical protein L0669_02450 [Flavobacterium bizetiae]|uniref:hypothetical protein n=1 Tax=Flavobacterium bizetiae TaxID=2704140 RepID=UPI0021E7F563|nr:hypothetical protein [Flavobacterium bizetiae]UTN04775.1 hypothetical protein L0669_02450 [Flavobacterium bizetiae]
MTRKQLENRKTKDLSPFIFSTMNQVIKHITKAKTQNKTTNSKCYKYNNLGVSLRAGLSAKSFAREVLG